MAFTAWLSAPAPTTCTSTAPVCRTTPAMAPATELGFERLDTLRISTGPPSGRDVLVLGSSTVRLTLPAHRFVRFCGGLSYARSAFKNADRGDSIERDRLVVGVADTLCGFGVGRLLA